MSQLKAYPEYKDSGVEWIGEIPKNWNTIKYKYIFTFVNGHGFPHELQGKRTGEKPFLKVSDISFNGTYVKKSLNYVSNQTIDAQGWNEIKPYSIITAKIGEALRINHRKINLVPCLIDNNMMALTPIDNNDKEFLYYALKIVDLDWYSNPGAVPSVNNRHFREDFLMLPQYQEQKNISKYLNRKTTEIDSLISDKERLIELLEEKRQAMITETVTKGLDPDVKMKDSGIKWIGDIPEHWNKTKLKYLSKETAVYGLNESAESYSDYGIRLLRTTDIDENGFLKEDNSVYINIKEVKYNSNQILKNGDILFSRSGTIGRTYIHQTYEKMTFASYLVKFSFNKTCYPLFIYYFTQGHSFIGWLNSVLVSSTISNVNGNRYANMPIVIPSYNEQVYISNYLTKEINKINILIKDIKLQISKIKEYRESLIYEAVTGKIDVRDYVTEQEEVY